MTDRDKKTVCQSAVDMSTYTSHTQSDSLTREFCNTLGSTYRKDCISKVDNNDEEIVSQKAINANDIRMCGKISNDSLRVSCSNTISLKLAIRTKTSGTCDDITGEKDQLYCRSQLSKIDDI